METLTVSQGISERPVRTPREPNELRSPELFSEFLHALSREEYRIYAHFTIKKGTPGGAKPGSEERLILARRVRVEGPEERLARNAREYRQYRFYAFVSHAEGESDEKWARRLQRELERYRIPVADLRTGSRK
jgi:hypothetical protein